MPRWIHDRAMSMLPDMKKTYGPEKAKQVAFAVATQQAHATGQAPKKWRGKPFGTPEGKREAKAKFDEPSKMQKSAGGILDMLMGKVAEEPEHKGPGFQIVDHLGNKHWLDASTIHSKMDLEKAVTPLMSECPHGIVREKIEEGWKALAESRKSDGQPKDDEKTASTYTDAMEAAEWRRRQETYDEAANRITERLMSTPEGRRGLPERLQYLKAVSEGKKVHPVAKGALHALLRGALGGAAGYGAASMMPAQSQVSPAVFGGAGAVLGALSGIGKGVREAEIKREMRAEADRFLETQRKIAAAAINQGSQVPLGSTNANREILRPTVTPSVMTSSEVPVTPPSGMGQANTSIAAAEPTEDQVAEFFKRHPNPPDDVLHRWAESRGWEPDEVEGLAYRLATRHAQFASGGKANEENKKPSDFSPDQIAKGMKVEQEHTPNAEDRKRIATDHLSEDPKYYNDPLFASDLAKKAVLEGFKKLFKESPKLKRRGELIDLADEAASRSAAKYGSLSSVAPHFLDSLMKMAIGGTALARLGSETRVATPVLDVAADMMGKLRDLMRAGKMTEASQVRQAMGALHDPGHMLEEFKRLVGQGMPPDAASTMIQARYAPRGPAPQIF